MDAKTREKRLAEYRRLFDEDRLEEAQAVLHQMPMITLEELHRMIDEAEVDDEPLTPKDIERLRAAEARRKARLLSRPTG